MIAAGTAPRASVVVVVLIPSLRQQLQVRRGYKGSEEAMALEFSDRALRKMRESHRPIRGAGWKYVAFVGIWVALLCVLTFYR
jgi:hypothetical protein